MQIEYLADHMEAAPLLASWHYQEWRSLLPTWSHAEALAELQSHTERLKIPTTFVAWEDNRPLGSASLLKSDLDGREHLSPWIASVFVHPEYRNRGLGRQLVMRAVAEARAIGVSIILVVVLTLVLNRGRRGGGGRGRSVLDAATPPCG